jgi:hypothetical protein
MANDPKVLYGVPPLQTGGIFSAGDFMAVSSGAVGTAIALAIAAANAAGGGLVVIPANFPAGGVIAGLGANTFLDDYRPAGLVWGPGTASPGMALVGPIVLDTVSLSSPAGASPALKTANIPAAALVAGGAGPGRGVRFTTSGTFANNANAKTINFTLGGGSSIFGTALTATTSTANSWRIEGEIYVRAAAGTVIISAKGFQGPGTPTWTIADVQQASLTFTGAIALAFAGTQTSAADIIQDFLVIDYAN